MGFYHEFVILSCARICANLNRVSIRRKVIIKPPCIYIMIFDASQETTPRKRSFNCLAYKYIFQ
jgi:hypothetical protein